MTHNGHINCPQQFSTDSDKKFVKKINQNQLKMPFSVVSLVWLRPYVTQKCHHVSSVLIYVTKMIEISNKRHPIEEACENFSGQAPINT